MDAVEGTGVDAVLASRAELRYDHRLWDVLGLDPLDQVAVLINDRVVRAVDAAHAAVDAQLRLDHVELLLDTRDGMGRTLDVADRATNAFRGDVVGPPFDL